MGIVPEINSYYKLLRQSWVNVNTFDSMAFPVTLSLRSEGCIPTVLKNNQHDIPPSRKNQTCKFPIQAAPFAVRKDISLLRWSFIRTLCTPASPWTSVSFKLFQKQKIIEAAVTKSLLTYNPWWKLLVFFNWSNTPIKRAE